MHFILSGSFTDQGIRGIKDAPKRAQATRDLAKKMGAEIKQIYLTAGESDLLLIVDAPDGDIMAKFSLALGMMGNHPHGARLAGGGIHEAGRRAAVTRPAIPALFPSSRVEGGKNPTTH
jgi:uncharacterized protein with GYD domain